MNNRNPQFKIQDNEVNNIENKKDYPTITDLMREQNLLNDNTNSVHHRRDLDSLG